MKRDRRTERALRKNGWVVLRFWEKDVLKKSDKCIARLKRKQKETISKKN